MTQQVKVLAARSNAINLILGTHTVEGDNWLPQDVL